jgi:hypothetical protein
MLEKQNITSELLGGIPEILYKYRVWEDKYHKRIITHNELFLPSADMFNDPFDASLPFQYSEDELTDENIIKKLLIVGRQLWPFKPENEIQNHAYERFKLIKQNPNAYWDNIHEQFKENLINRYGILSLTSNRDNLLMWSHYADSHRGFVVGFNKFELYNTINGMLGKVNYDDKFPIAPMFDENPSHLAMLIMTKSKHWEYEDEFRITKSDANKKAFTMKNSVIKEIIFGSRINPDSKAEIIKNVKSRAHQIKLFDSIINKKEFKVDIVEIIN